MSLLSIYTVVVILAEGATIFGGRWLDSAIPDYAMAIALASIFGVLIVAWPIAVRIDNRLFGKD